MSKSEKAIILQNVSLKIGKTLILDDLHLELPRGKMISILGPSGARKNDFTKFYGRLFKGTKRLY